ncbi:hypothetical protein Cpir12675_005640 [Ceratocystis pirilliformis]|uniref:BTB domain-containing protein n=1 Tax=Ceratocystis pirilliformis TaxID=259994 RepID=A0ABR3YPL7_9PEZI
MTATDSDNDEISPQRFIELQNTILDIAKNNNKLRKLPVEDRFAGTPLNKSPKFEALLEACRRGDLKTCHELIISGVNINARDRYDYTPLILASICGHFELVKLLLDYGALAERNTFQGERCIYGALTLKIRNLLLSYDFSKATDPLREWSGHINSIRSGQPPGTPDFRLRIKDDSGASCGVHRMILAARSPFFRDMLAKDPGLTSWTAQGVDVDEECLHTVHKFLYLEQIPDSELSLRNNIKSPAASRILEGCKKLAQEFDLPGLEELLDARGQLNVARKAHQQQVNLAQVQMNEFFAEFIMKQKMVASENEVDSIQWSYANHALADVLLKVEYVDESLETGTEAEFELNNQLSACEVSIRDTNLTEVLPRKEDRQQLRKYIIYPAHKAILARSPYFKHMFTSGFMEGQSSQSLHMVSMTCAPVTLEVILANLYFEKGEISLPYSLDLLYTADEILLEKLVNKAALTISSQGMVESNVWEDRTHKLDPKKKSRGGRSEAPDGIDIYEIIHAAWDLGVQRLEDFAARFFSSRLEDYIDDPEFLAIIRKSAERVKDRQATDTIELLDDIRHHLKDRFRMRFQDVSLVMERDPTQAQHIQAEQTMAKTKTAIRTLSGEMAEDEFAADDMNYEFLMDRLDKLLEKTNEAVYKDKINRQNVA